MSLHEDYEINKDETNKSETKEYSGMKKDSQTLGIISFVLSIVAFFIPIGFIFSAIGLICGLSSYKNAFGLIGTVISVIHLSIVIFTLTSFIAILNIA